MAEFPSEVVLYTRVGCHLCDDAKALLERNGLAVRAIDIDQDPGLVARYDQCVPVVEIDGRERFSAGGLMNCSCGAYCNSGPRIDFSAGARDADG